MGFARPAKRYTTKGIEVTRSIFNKKYIFLLKNRLKILQQSSILDKLTCSAVISQLSLNCALVWRKLRGF